MKTRKKNVKTKPVDTKPAQENAQPQSPTANVVTEYSPPPPEMLLELATREEDRRILDEYIETIQVLRDEKRFTFREIAEWLIEKGVQTDHNAVYRAYIRHVPLQYQDEVGRDVALEEEAEQGQ